MRYVCNVFTIAMAPEGGHLTWHPISVNVARGMLRPCDPREVELGCQRGLTQAVGHAHTAELANSQLGEKLIEFSRLSVRLEHGDDLVLCQYVGPRLPEGVTVLPEGAKIVWYHAQYYAPRAGPR